MTSRTPGPEAEAIETSLELAAEHAGDLTPRVYASLFAHQPEMEALFWRDRDGAIRGEMLARVFEAILDFVGARRYAHLMIQCEIVTHAGYDVPPAVFATFFAIVRDGVRDACAEAWTREMAVAWDHLLSDLAAYIDAGWGEGGA